MRLMRIVKIKNNTKTFHDLPSEAFRRQICCFFI